MKHKEELEFEVLKTFVILLATFALSSYFTSLYLFSEEHPLWGIALIMALAFLITLVFIFIFLLKCVGRLYDLLD